MREVKSGLGPASGLAWLCANAPMVITPIRRKLAQWSLMCRAKEATSEGSTPLLFSSPDVFT